MLVLLLLVLLLVLLRVLLFTYSAKPTTIRQWRLLRKTPRVSVTSKGRLIGCENEGRGYLLRLYL